MKLNSKINIFSVILVVISVGVYIFGTITSSSDLLMISIISIYTVGFIFGLSNIYKNIALVMFLLTTILFFFGRVIAQNIFGYKEYGFGIYQTNIIDGDLLILFYKLIYISIFGIIIGYFLNDSRKSKRIKEIETQSNRNFETVLMWISKLAFYILVVFRILVLLERVSFVNENSYFESYNDYISSYPLIIVRLSQSYSIPFFILLSLKLKKSKIIIPILFFMLEGVTSLLTGRRMNFILNVIIIVIYFIHDDFVNKESKSKWLNKGTFFGGIVSIPLLITISNMVFAWRSGSSVLINSFGQVFGEFFYKQGVTLTTVLNSFIYERQTQSNSLFILGPIISFLKNNVITNLFFDTEQLVGQTIESGMNSPLFGHRISFFIDPNAYLGGRGYGSSYLAESYVDFGLVGVIVVSLIIGYVLCQLYRNLDRGIILSSFSYILLMNIMVIPRSETTSFITNSLTINNILMYLTIISVTNLVYSSLINRSIVGRKKNYV